MTPYALIAFGIFSICCLAQYPMRDRIVRALERHPQTLDRIPGSLMFGWGLHRFAMRNDHRRLADERLNRAIRAYRRLYSAAICAWLAYGAFIVMGMQRR